MVDVSVPAQTPASPDNEKSQGSGGGFKWGRRKSQLGEKNNNLSPNGPSSHHHPSSRCGQSVHFLFAFFGWLKQLIFSQEHVRNYYQKRDLKNEPMVIPASLQSPETFDALGKNQCLEHCGWPSAKSWGVRVEAFLLSQHRQGTLRWSWRNTLRFLVL